MKLKKQLNTWKVYNSYASYQIYPDGGVYSIKSGKFLKPCEERYLTVTLSEKGVVKKFFVHRLVATLFIDNPKGLPHVNHKDGNRHNPHKDNLEWCTPKENSDHAHLIGLMVNQVKNNRPDLSIPIAKLDMNGNYLELYPSANEAARQNKIAAKWIRASANGGSMRVSGGKKKWMACLSAGGFKWTNEVKQYLITQK